MERFDIGKLVRGFNIFNGANLGKLIYYLVIVAIALAIFWRAFLKTDQKTTQKATTITNVTQVKEERYLLGVEIFGLKLGLKW